jgi:hypothetical protein
MKNSMRRAASRTPFGSSARWISRSHIMGDLGEGETNIVVIIDDEDIAHGLH